MKLTALIPAYNDAYTLQLCLASIGPHLDEIIVLDDASTDETPDVALEAARAQNTNFGDGSPLTPADLTPYWQALGMAGCATPESLASGAGHERR